MNRLEEKYKNEVVPRLMEKHNYKTLMLVPKIEKIVFNMGVGDAIANSKNLENAVADLEKITGLKPVETKAKKSIASFKVREGHKIGCKVTLRGENMYNFLDKLISISLPRVRDFRGLSPKSFDGRGNYTIGIKEQLIFPEINFDEVEKVRGMDIVIVTTAKTKSQRKPKLKVREYTRCSICGRPHAVMSKFGICRICFRELAYKGQIPGVKKSSW